MAQYRQPIEKRKSKLQEGTTHSLGYNSKWITDLNEKPKTMKIEASTGENLCDLKSGKDFFDVTVTP